MHADFFREVGAVGVERGAGEEFLVFVNGHIGEFALELLGALLFAVEFLGKLAGFTGEEAAEFIFEVFILGEEFDILLANGFLHCPDVSGEALQIVFA